MSKDFNRGDTIIYREESSDDRRWFSFTSCLYLGFVNGKHKVDFENGRTDGICENWLYKDMETAVEETLAAIKPYYNQTIAAHKKTVARLEAERTSKVEELLALQGHRV